MITPLNIWKRWLASMLIFLSAQPFLFGGAWVIDNWIPPSLRWLQFFAILGLFAIVIVGALALTQVLQKHFPKYFLSNEKEVYYDDVPPQR